MKARKGFTTDQISAFRSLFAEAIGTFALTIVASGAAVIGAISGASMNPVGVEATDSRRCDL